MMVDFGQQLCFCRVHRSVVLSCLALLSLLLILFISIECVKLPNSVIFPFNSTHSLHQQQDDKNCFFFLVSSRMFAKFIRSERELLGFFLCRLNRKLDLLHDSTADTSRELEMSRLCECFSASDKSLLRKSFQTFNTMFMIVWRRAQCFSAFEEVRQSFSFFLCPPTTRWIGLSKTVE